MSDSSPTPRIVFRGGSDTYLNLTPRPEKDMTRQPGRSPGLSVSESIELAALPGKKAQVINLDLLGDSLTAFADDPALEGGEAGHFSIAPTLPDGTIDMDLLREWANTRGTDNIHPLSVTLKNA